MRGAALLALPLLALAACGTPAPAPEARAMSAMEAECRAEARASVPARELGRASNFSNYTYTDQLRVAQQDAENRATMDCLRRRGAIRGGGVEPVRR